MSRRVMVFALFAAASASIVLLAAAGRSPYVFLSSDSANIASFMAARAYPARFAADAALDDRSNFEFYWTLHFVLFPWLKRWLGSYGAVFLMVQAVQLFAQAAGFYLLGRELLQSRIVALALAGITTFWYFPLLLLADGWGLFPDAMPRTTYQAIVPYLLLLVVRYGRLPRAWPYITGLTAASVYIHPPSAPAWVFAIFVAGCLMLPREWTASRKVTWALWQIIVSSLVLAPFGARYLLNHQHGRTENYAAIYNIAKFRFAKGFLDVPLTLRTNLFGHYGMAGTLALVVAVVVIRYRRIPVPVPIRIIGAIMAAIAVFASVLPLVEQWIARAIRAMPPEVDIIRSLRYLPPLALVLLFWAVEQAYLGIESTANRRAAILVAAFALLLALVAFRPASPLPKAGIRKETISYLWRERRMPGLDAREKDQLRILDYLKGGAGEGTRVLALDFPELPVRYYAVRPLAYSEKDGGIFAYANHQKLQQWFRNTQLIDGVSARLRAGSMSLADGLEALRPLGPGMIVLPTEWTLRGSAINVAVRTAAYSIIDVRSASKEALPPQQNHQ